MLSRVADSIYWMGRYLERAENLARFIGANLSLTLDVQMVLEEQWEPLLYATGDYHFFHDRKTSTEYSAFLQKIKGELGDFNNSLVSQKVLETRNEVIFFLSLEPQNPNSILSCLEKARDNARLVRGYISTEMWEQINKLYYYIRKSDTQFMLFKDPLNFFQELRMSLYTLVGLTEATFQRDDGWCFQQLGMYLERADKTTRILDVKYFILLPKLGHVGSVIDDMLWAALLQSVSGFQTFKQKYQEVLPAAVVEFLLLDRKFPRSVLFCLKSAEECLNQISSTQPGSFSNSAEQKIGRLRNQLEYSSVDEIIISGLHEYLEDIKRQLNHISTDIYQVFIKFLEEN